MKVIALIPAFNEEKTLAGVIAGVQEYVGEVVVVNDGSSDATAEVARKEGAIVLSHVLNRGVGAAQSTGYHYGIEKGYDFIVQVDGDGQHNPRYIPELLKVVTSGYDMVIGSRFLNPSFRHYSLIRRKGVPFLSRLTNLLAGLTVTDVTSGFRVYRVKKLQELSRHQDRHWAVEQTLEAARKGWRIKEISVEMPTRQIGETQFNVKTILLYPVRVLEAILKILIFRR